MSEAPLPFRRPAFVVGVTGNVDPQPGIPGGDANPQDIQDTVRRFLEFLRHGARAGGGVFYKGFKTHLPDPGRPFGLDEWPGLPHTPIVVLTSLAPGADTIVARTALDLGLTVRAFLPFPPELYVDASTFVEDTAHPTDEERKRQEDFRELIGRIEGTGQGSVHTVLLAGDVDLDEPTLAARMLAERDAVFPDAAGRKPRSYRYQAAGEYIAAHCDLLIALWDDDADTGKPEGTGSIVEAKLRGITPGLIASPNSFSWVDCGSVAHFYMRREKNGGETDAAKVGKVRFLHAADLPGELLKSTKTMPRGPEFQKLLTTLWHVPHAFRGQSRKRWLAYREWQRTGILFLCRLAKNLDTFNSVYRTPAELARPLCELLDPELKKTPSVSPPPVDTRAHDLLTHSLETYHALVPLVAARRFAADESGRLRVNSERALRTMIALVFVFALGVHLLAHWEPSEESRARGGPADKPSLVAAAPEDGSLHPRIEPSAESAGGFTPRAGFGLAGLLAGLASLFLFWWHRQKQVEERDQDYRAFSEGLRVQIFWCLAGLPRAVAGHYMARQRNDLEWIRGAISSLAMPHHRWSRWFDDAGGSPTAPRAELKRKRLLWVQRLWVEDQARYHVRRARELTHALHSLHKVGAVLALGGVLQTCVALGEVWGRWLDGEPARGFFAHVLVAGSKTALLLLLGWLIAWMGRAVGVIREKGSRREAFSSTAWSSLQAFLNMLVPTRHGPDRRPSRGEGWKMVLAFGLHLPLAFGAAMTATAACVLLSASHPGLLPSALNLIVITGGVSLVAGALAVAWTEKNLFSEQAYRYNAMASLFNAAKSRVQAALDDLDAEADQAKWEPHFERIRKVLYDLGVEALDENAEWLILHRARPMEPVMAG